MNALVSVLMPVFNGEATLPACLESILSQIYPEFELIVVDDGSRDGSAALLGSYARKDARIKLLLETHGGIVAALNRGLEACSGSYIARMDADDVMHPERLGKQLRFLQERPGLALIGALIEPFRLNGTPSSGAVNYHAWLNSLQSDEEIRRDMFVDLPIAHPTFFGEKDLFARLGGYRDAPWAEDYDFFFRARVAGAGFGKVPELLVFRGDGPGRITRVDGRYRRKMMFRAKAHYFARGSWMERKDGVVIGGTGPSGRVVASALLAEGVKVRGFVDNRAGPPGRTVMGIPAHGFPAEIPDEIFHRYRAAYFILCIGEASGRETFADRLINMGFAPDRDFTRFI